MRQVWILNHYAQEPGSPGGTRHWSLARHLRNSGWDATLIAASIEHGSGRQRIGGNQATLSEFYGGVRFLWLKTSGYSGNGTDRVRNMIQYTRAVLDPARLASLPKPDLIIGSSVHPLAAWAGRRLAKRHKVPFVFEVRDLWPQTLVDMGRIGARHPATVALRILEKSLYRSACKVISVLPRAVEYITQLGIDPDRVVWIPNGVETDTFPPLPPKQRSDEFTVMYFGAHGAANGLDNVVDAMAILARDANLGHIVLRLIGDGPEKMRLMDRANGLPNVRFEDPVPKARIPSLAQQADAFVFNLIGADVFRYGISSNKLFDFMAAGRPTLFSCSAGNNPIDEAQAGWTVRPEDPAALADAIVRLSQCPQEELARMGIAGRRHLEEHYDMRKLSLKLSSVLDECVAAA